MVQRVIIAVCLLFIMMTLPLARAASPGIQSLAGEWMVRLDPENTGMRDHWAAVPLAGATAAHEMACASLKT